MSPDHQQPPGSEFESESPQDPKTSHWLCPRGSSCWPTLVLLAKNLEQRCPPFSNSSILLLGAFQSFCSPIWPKLFTKMLEALRVFQKKMPKAGLQKRLFLAVPLPLHGDHGGGISRLCWKSEIHRKNSLPRNPSGMMVPGEYHLFSFPIGI